eukprot:gene778-864_t
MVHQLCTGSLTVKKFAALCRDFPSIMEHATDFQKFLRQKILGEQTWIRYAVTRREICGAEAHEIRSFLIENIKYGSQDKDSTANTTDAGGHRRRRSTFVRQPTAHPRSFEKSKHGRSKSISGPLAEGLGLGLFSGIANYLGRGISKAPSGGAKDRSEVSKSLSNRNLSGKYNNNINNTENNTNANTPSPSHSRAPSRSHSILHGDFTFANLNLLSQAKSSVPAPAPVPVPVPSLARPRASPSPPAVSAPGADHYRFHPKAHDVVPDPDPYEDDELEGGLVLPIVSRAHGRQGQAARARGGPTSTLYCPDPPQE